MSTERQGQEYTIFFVMSTANTTTRFALWNVVLRVCGLQYVDEIVQSFNKCMNGHRSDIKCKLDLPRHKTELFTFFFIPFEASGWNVLIQNILYII
jgi:hypothetical protein